MAGIAVFYPIVKALNGTVDPYLIAFFRFFIASLVLVPVMAYRNSLHLPPKRDLVFFLLVAFCAVAPTPLIVMGIASTNSVVAAILINANSLIVAVLATLLLSEQVSHRKMVGLGIGFLGVILVVLNGANPFANADSAYFLGSMVLLFAASLSALNKTYSKVYVRKYDGLYVTFFSVTLGSLLLAMFIGLRGGFDGLTALTPSLALPMLAIGIFGTAIPWVIWNSSLKHLDAHVAASFNLLIPVFAALYSLVFFQESFTVWMFAGFVLTSFGIYLIQKQETTIVVPAV